MKVLTEGSVVALPSLSDQCWLSVALHRKSSQGVKFMCPNFPSPSAAHLSPSESFQGKVSDQQAAACEPNPASSCLFEIMLERDRLFHFSMGVGWGIPLSYEDDTKFTF